MWMVMTSPLCVHFLHFVVWTIKWSYSEDNYTKSQEYWSCWGWILPCWHLSIYFDLNQSDPNQLLFTSVLRISVPVVSGITLYIHTCKGQWNVLGTLNCTIIQTMQFLTFTSCYCWCQACGHHFISRMQSVCRLAYDLFAYLSIIQVYIAVARM
jgi:hypothetical protein